MDFAENGQFLIDRRFCVWITRQPACSSFILHCFVLECEYLWAVISGPDVATFGYRFPSCAPESVSRSTAMICMHQEKVGNAKSWMFMAPSLQCIVEAFLEYLVTFKTFELKFLLKFEEIKKPIFQKYITSTLLWRVCKAYKIRL